MRLVVALPLSLAAGLASGFVCFRETAPGRSAKAAVANRKAVGIAASTATVVPAEDTEARAQRLIAIAAGGGEWREQYSELYLAIQSFTAGDFDHWLNDPAALKAVLDRMKSTPIGTFDSIIHSLIARWIALDPEAVATWAPRLLKTFPSSYEYFHIREALIKKRPDVVLAFMESNGELTAWNEPLEKTVCALAARDERKAREWMKTITDPATRAEAEMALWTGIVQADPLRVVELASPLTKRSHAQSLLAQAAMTASEKGTSALRRLVTAPMPDWMRAYILHHLADRDPDTVLDLASKITAAEEKLQFGVELAMKAMARRDLEKAKAKIDDLPEMLRDTAVKAVATQWAQTNRMAALHWQAGLSKTERKGPGEYGGFIASLTALAEHDPTAARAAGETLPAGEVRNEALGRLAESFVRDGGDYDEAVRTYGLMGEAANLEKLSDATQRWASRNPQAAAEWATARPTAALQIRALSDVVSIWGDADPTAVQAWLTQFPAGEVRDHSIAAFLLREKSGSPDVTVLPAEFDTWFEVMEDPWQRTRVARRSYEERKKTDPAAARTWLASLPRLDAEVVRITLRDP